MKTTIIKLLALFALAAAMTCAAPLYYSISVDTSANAGSPAELFFQFAAGGPGADAGLATVTGLSGFTPPSSAFVLDNSLNPFVQLSVTLGSSLDFIVVFDGPMVNSPGGSGDVNTFSLSVFTPSFSPLFSSDPLGFLVLVDVLSDGSTVLTDLSNGELSSDGPHPIPEPASFGLLCAGLAAFTLKRRR